MSVKNALRASLRGLSQMLYEHVLSLKQQDPVSKIEKVKEETTWLNIKDSVQSTLDCLIPER